MSFSLHLLSLLSLNITFRLPPREIPFPSLSLSSTWYLSPLPESSPQRCPSRDGHQRIDNRPLTFERAKLFPIRKRWFPLDFRSSSFTDRDGSIYSGSRLKISEVKQRCLKCWSIKNTSRDSHLSVNETSPHLMLVLNVDRFRVSPHRASSLHPLIFGSKLS